MAYIFRKPKSRFWWVGYSAGNKPAQKSLKVTAMAAARVLLSEYQTLEAREAHHSTLLTIRRGVPDAVREYLKDNEGKAPETLREKIGALKRFEEYLGDRASRLEDITFHAVENYHKKRLQKTLAGANKDLKVIKTFLNYAVKKGYLAANQAANVRKAKPTKKMFRSLSFEEAELLLKTAKEAYPHIYPVCAALYYLGLRKREAIFLEWADIEFSRDIVFVRSKPENRIKDCEERLVPLNRKLKTLLKKIPRKNRFVFPTPSGVPWRNNLYREFRKVVAAAGLKGVNIQTMRETFGSHLLMKGVSIYLVSKYLGHSSVDVTTRHYAYIPIEQTHKEINLL